MMRASRYASWNRRLQKLSQRDRWANVWDRPIRFSIVNGTTPFEVTLAPNETVELECGYTATAKPFADVRYAPGCKPEGIDPDRLILASVSPHLALVGETNHPDIGDPPPEAA